MADALPYRPNVGIALFSRDGRVLIARRLGDDGPETVPPGYEWQAPQGGVDADEDLAAAARRELFEETGVVSVEPLGETVDWMTYDFPPYAGPAHRLCAFRGQRQKWFALRFVGEEREIDVTRGAPGAEPEFSQWRWERLERLPGLVAPFKRAIYEEVARAFRRFAA